MNNSIKEVSEQVSDVDFQNAFSCSKDGLDELIAQKQISLPSILEIAPSTIDDPTKYIYDETMMVKKTICF